MGIPLRVIDLADKPRWDEREAGMMWRYPAGDIEGRECWWVCLPTTHPEIGTPGHPSALKWTTTDRGYKPPHALWTVTGTPPLITVTPSIDVVRNVRRRLPNGLFEWVREGSYWHGHITNGQIV